MDAEFWDNIYWNIHHVWKKISAGDITAFDFSDVLWLVGIILVIILIVKIGFKLLKVILIIVAIALLVGFLITSGIIPV